MLSPTRRRPPRSDEMSVRRLLEETEEVDRTTSNIRWVEYLFLFVGLIGLDYYLWTTLDATYSQAYESWSFDRQTRGQPRSFLRFLEEELGLKSAPAEASRPAVPQTPRFSAKTANRPTILPKPAPLSVIGRISVPRLQLTAMVREGVGDDVLRKAVGHIPSSPMPGQPGNVAFAGHRDTFFRGLKDIRRNDEIVVSTAQGEYTYVVESTTIVTPKDVSVLKPIAGEQALTLVTCYPFYYVGSAPKRFIVHAKQVDGTAQPAQTGS